MAGFRIKLAGLALLGLAARLAYAYLADAPHGLGDDIWYHTIANDLVHGRGYSDPLSSLAPGGARTFGAGGEPIPTAFHLRRPALSPGRGGRAGGARRRGRGAAARAPQRAG